MNNRRSKREAVQQSQQSGFTLVELMVVVAIIGILAAIGIPKLTAFVRSAETSEATEQMGRIAKALPAYQDSRQMSSGEAANAITAYNKLTIAGSDPNELTKLIPQVDLADNAKWEYTISALTDGASNAAKLCIKATAGSETGNPSGTVLFSSVKTDSTDYTWDGHFSRGHYVSGDAHVAGGSCTEAGAAQ